MLVGGPVALAYAKMTPEERAGVESDYLASIERFRSGDGSYAVDGEFVFLVGAKP